VFMMFAETQEEQKEWIDALKQAMDSLRGGTATPQTSSTTGLKAGQTPTAAQIAASQPAAAVTSGAREQLNRIRGAVDFLQADTKVLEFWQIWIESVPPPNEVEAGKQIDFSVAASADLKKLTWRTSGPQNIFIQKMVDFFWNVGAPEPEIDKLNDVGALINPMRIGSWIDMSAKDGMDGGWYFPVPMALVQCIDAADAGEPTQKLLEWAARHAVDQCMSVGRDMGAAPPRQTEFRLALPGDASAQLEVALAAFAHFGFPKIPDAMLNVLTGNTTPGLILSVITSNESFVRLGVLVPSPPMSAVQALSAAVEAPFAPLQGFMNDAFRGQTPSFVEVQFLKQGFGYGVYKEGFDAVFHWNAGSDVGQT